MLVLETIQRILLASESPRRLELLRSLGPEVRVIPSDYEERMFADTLPIELAMRHARGKLLASYRAHPPGADREPPAYEGQKPKVTVRVAADTVVDVDGTSFGKPRNDSDAKRMLQTLSGREHVVHTAFAIGLPDSEEPALHIWEDNEEPTVEPVVKVHSTRVRFHELSAPEISDYVATGEPIDKAGAYGIQGLASALVDSIDGDFYTVMGFPLGHFIRTMRELRFIFR